MQEVPRSSIALRPVATVVGAAAILAAAAALAVSGAGAQTVSQLNSKISTARSQADQLGTQIDARTQQLAAARQQAAAAAARETQLTTLLAQGEQRAAVLQEIGRASCRERV